MKTPLATLLAALAALAGPPAPAAAAEAPPAAAGARQAGPAAPAAPPAAPEVEALVRRCVEAYGGPAAVTRAAVLRQRGTVTSLLHPGRVGRLTRLYARPSRLRVEVGWGEGPPEVRILDGQQGWRFGRPADGPALASMVLQGARLDLPALLLGWQGRIADRGTVTVGGRALRALALEVAPGVVLEADLDPETGRILRSRGTAAGAMPVEFVTTYDDFRVVDGVLFAFREGNWANGATTGETVLERVEVLEALGAEAFRP